MGGTNKRGQRAVEEAESDPFPSEPTHPYRSATHARTRDAADAGVRRCMDLMVANRWVTGESHRMVADEHGVSPVTVKNWATNASRVLRELAADDINEIRARLIAKAETIGRAAMDRQAATMAGELYPNPDLKAAANAVELEAKLQGLLVQKHEIDVSVQAFAKLSKDDQIAKAKETIRELQLFVDRAEGKIIDG